jgi:chemotaxis-related protein WspD
MSAPSALVRADLQDCWNKIGVQGDSSCPELEKYIHCRNCPVYMEAAARLLDSSVPAGYLTEWTGYYARPKNAPEPGQHSLFIFRVGAEWLALPVDLVKEVASLRTVHSLPHRPSGSVRGIANVRGELLICLSLNHVLGLELSVAEPAKQRMELRRLLVIKASDGPLAFPVDEAHGIHSCAARELTAVPATVSRAATAFTHAILRWNEHSVGCLDRQLLLKALDRSLT